MSLALVCRVCLSNKRLEIIANTQLQTIFENLTKNQLITDDGRPESVCYMCHQLLLKCSKLVDLSRRAEKILSQLVCCGTKLSQNNLRIHCATIQKGSPHTLEICKSTLISIPSGKHEVIVKTEAEEKKNNVKFDAENSPNLPDKVEVEIPYENNSRNAEAGHKPKFDADKDLDSNLANPTTSTQNRDVPNKSYGVKIIKTIKKAAKDTVKSKVNKQKNYKTVQTYDCSECPKTFKQKAYLKRHLRTHTGETPYICEICNQGFTDSVILKQHVRIHSGEAPYICHVCSKAFNRKAHLTEHIRTHSGEKPFTCATCSCTFSHRSSLTRHMRTHTGERPYICLKCSRQFSQIFNLKKHKCVKCSDTMLVEPH